MPARMGRGRSTSRFVPSTSRCPIGWRNEAARASWRRIESRRLIEQIRAVNIPTVDLLGIHDLEGIPTVRSDHEAVANAAAEEFLRRGFRTFAFCGYPGLRHSDERCRYFVGRLTPEGFAVNVYRPARTRRATNISATLNQGLLDEDDVAAWLSALPKPLGLMRRATYGRSKFLTPARGERSPCPTKWP